MTLTAWPRKTRLARKASLYCSARGSARTRHGVLRLPLGWLRHYTREPYVRLGRFEYWLRPFPGGVQVFRRRDTGDLAMAPRDPRLQRAVLDWLGAGNTWRVGGMFILPEHVRHLGSAYYRSHWPPQGLGV